MAEFTVNFSVEGDMAKGKSVRAAKGTDVLTAAIKTGYVLNATCGGEGLCGKCKVRIGKKMTLACDTLIEKDLDVIIPKESLTLHEKFSGNAEEFTKGVILKREGLFLFSPLVRKLYLELPKPTADDSASYLERITRGLEEKFNEVHVSAKAASIKHLGDILRDSDFCVTAVLGYRDDGIEILSVEPGDTTKANYGFAFDIGTTTVVGQLIDLNTKDILGTRIAFNRQANFGSDVITRIICASEKSGLEKLNRAVLDNINEIIEDLAKANSIALSDIYAVTAAGNMTMMHLLLKIDPANIRKPPYIPATTVFPTVHSLEVGVETNPKGIMSFLPGVSTYMGGDIVSGILACGMSEKSGISLLIDIGTNGEIVLGNSEWMIGSAASAGPSFEGSGLACGMKAVKGAIEKVSIAKGLDVKFQTIGNDEPKGICGSGYIDLLCQMLKAGVIDKAGRINRQIKSDRIRKAESNYEFVVAFKKEAGRDPDIVIQEDDIENLKRSKGAIYSAMIALLNKVEKNIGDVNKFYIAGGFGNYLNIENSIFIGLLPDIERNIYEFIGNSSLAGARMSLVSHEAYKKTADIYKNITYVDLSAEPNYMDEYVASLFFPHTDSGRFPSVRL